MVKVLVKYDLPDHYTKMYHTILSGVLCVCVCVCVVCVLCVCVSV